MNVDFRFFRTAAVLCIFAGLAAAQETLINGIECVLVRSGTFIMGSPLNEGRDNETPQHQVTLTNDFWISKYPVTQKQYRDLMGSNPSVLIGDNKPVIDVTWDEADAFCKAVGGRLLTEAEWEFAARGGNNSNGYIYSGSNDLNEVGWYWDNSPSGTKPVGQKSPNELGIYDMSGNVWEWCSDWYGDYPSGSVTDPTGPLNGSYRIARGGSWRISATNSRVAARGSNHLPFFGNPYLGLRVAFNSAATTISNIQKSDDKHGITLKENIVSSKAEFYVILPNDKVLEVKAVIYDNTGNAVFETSGKGKLYWDLTNAAGRNVANGTYLIIVEVKGIKGTYAYSAKVGVKR